MALDDNLRGRVAAQLGARSAVGGPLHRDAAASTEQRYATDVGRVRFRKNIIERYMARETPRCDGLSAIITAGAPGSGKSSMLRARVADLSDYRIVDADIVKDYLIEQALQDGIYDHLLIEILDDGHELAPRELSGLVHSESVKLADQIRRICISRKENIAIEGTLSWDGQGPRVFRELARSEYADIEVYGLDIGRAGAREQALNRWWQGRLDWANGADALGGRFTPEEAIDLCYPEPGGQSVCTANALRLIETAQSGEIPHVHVTILRRQASGALEVADEQFYRQ